MIMQHDLVQNANANLDSTQGSRSSVCPQLKVDRRRSHSAVVDLADLKS